MSESNIDLWTHSPLKAAPPLCLCVCGYLGWRSWCWCSSSRGPSGSARPGRTVDEVGRQGRGHTQPAGTGTPAALGACRTCGHKKNKTKTGQVAEEAQEGGRFISRVFPRLWYRSEMAPPNSDPSSIPTMKRVWLYGSHSVHAHTDWRTQTQAVRQHNTTLVCPLRATSRKLDSFAFVFPGSNAHCPDKKGP